MQVRFALLDVIDLAWTHMVDSEKVKIASSYLQPMLRIISAFPVSNAQKLVKLADSGNLEIRGGLDKVIHEDGEFKASFKEGDTASFDVVINACGTSNDYKR